MAVSPNNQDIQSISKPEEDESIPNSNISRAYTASSQENTEEKEYTSALLQAENEDNDRHSSSISATNNTQNSTQPSDHTGSISLTTNTDLISSPANTIGLPFSENGTDDGVTSEILRNTTSRVPPALPPRPANLSLPQVNGLPHPPHAFSTTQGKFCLKLFFKA